jgi:hypothetical protein
MKYIDWNYIWHFYTDKAPYSQGVTLCKYVANMQTLNREFENVLYHDRYIPNL